MKKWHLIAGGIVTLLLAGLWFTSGAGVFKRYTTRGGVYWVDVGDGTRCYINKDGMAMSCLPKPRSEN